MLHSKGAYTRNVYFDLAHLLIFLVIHQSFNMINLEVVIRETVRDDDDYALGMEKVEARKIQNRLLCK